MIPAAFEYERADSSEHAIELMGRYGEDAKLLAGGQSLLSFMKLRLARPSALVDIGRLSELEYVREDGDTVSIGALTKYEDAHRNELLRSECPILAFACGEVGDPQVRHVGTVGGGVAHGDPASDVPSVLLALDAELVVRGADGSRTVTARDFFRGAFDVDLGPQELLTEIRVPKTRGRGWSYVKFHPRAQDWAIAGVATVVERWNGGIGSAALALTNLGATPLRATAVEEALVGGSSPKEAVQQVAIGIAPVDDAFASAEYRTHLAPILARRAIEEALAR
jgi:aerobic carbon-monoxide dehydrogenase medium subunit